ncbi:hypothetical protein ABE65_012660 [Fictibacillus phosphorivorans]|uniref:Uncharacterized protein n=1 Tax=Fictibacillus phosphorivorans TaxID=1221500 RepID=A0A160IPJ2_9BACL|nr:hypothetical protein [Fictibacillus phosphorivorans]ANC77602.1 hypothetical protein ABE65_012660 [Fictibacillus phosphorivorans]
MEFSIPDNLKKYYWYLFPIVMILMVINEVLYGQELQYYELSEMEDIGRLLFVLLVKAFESALITILLIGTYMKLKSMYKNNKRH